jgi:hypothetical protein
MRDQIAHLKEMKEENEKKTQSGDPKPESMKTGGQTAFSPAQRAVALRLAAQVGKVCERFHKVLATPLPSLFYRRLTAKTWSCFPAFEPPQ